MALHGTQWWWTIRSYVPTIWLSDDSIRLCPNIYPWLMISIYYCGYSIYVTPPFNTRLVYGQQLFLSPAIAAFCWSILTAIVSNWIQTIIILLKQYSAGSITTCIHVNYKWQFKIWHLQDRRIAQKFTEFVKCMILFSTPNPRSFRAGKIRKQSSNVSIMMYVLCIIICQA